MDEYITRLNGHIAHLEGMVMSGQGQQVKLATDLLQEKIEHNAAKERIAELEAGRQSAHAVMSRAFEVIEICHRVLHFNLNRMIADDSDDYNQAVRDAADATYRFMQEISAAHAIALAADSGAAE